MLRAESDSYKLSLYTNAKDDYDKERGFIVGIDFAIRAIEESADEEEKED